jgi:two-component system, OmpR family, sensor histidine kinase QseC
VSTPHATSEAIDDCRKGAPPSTAPHAAGDAAPDRTGGDDTTTWFSLRRRLVILLLGGVTVCWLGTLIWSYVDTHHEIDELLDSQLILEAQTLLALSGHEADEMLDIGETDHRSQKRLRFQIWTDAGQLVLHSADTPRAPLASADGFSEGSDAEGKHPHWRYYGQWNEDRTLHVLVGENHHVRDEMIGHIAWRLLLPAMFGLPLLGAWVWLATRRGLRPLNAVAELIAAREPQHLKPLEPETAPDEIRPLIESINHLFARVEKTLESERRFTADAAHELRTPLAALAAQAQVAMRARNDDERRHAFNQLVASSRRASRLVDQLLTLARLDPADAVPSGVVSLDSLAEDICAMHGALALEKNITLELDAMPAIVSGDCDMLRILMRNLVDNAIRYTPPGGRVAVAVTATALSVADTGPGIPVSERERVFDRFHRLAGQDTEGSGLGLSIVARIAERHGARVELSEGDEGRGLRVSVSFPVSDRPMPADAS